MPNNPEDKVEDYITGGVDLTDYNRIDLKTLDLANSRLKKNIETTEIQNFIQLIKHLDGENKINNQNKDNEREDIVQELVKELNLDILHNKRSAIYQEYDSIVSKISYASRALKVLANNILKPDNFTNDILLISGEDEEKDSDIAYIIDEYKNFMDYFKIDSLKIKEIISTTLKYGIYFIEIVDSETDLKVKKILTESNNIKDSYETYHDKKFRINLVGDFSDEINISEDSNNDSVIRDKEEAKNLFYLRYHQPSKIIKIADDITTYGYLELKNVNDTKNIGNLYHNIQLNTNPVSYDDSEEVIDKLIEKLEEKIKNIIGKDNIDISNSPELYQMLSKIIKTSKEKKNDINIRYIPVDKMQEFKVGNGIYGESIFKDSIFLAKIIILLQTSHVIARLNDSVEKENIYFEVGISRNAKDVINKIKEAKNKKKISLDKFGSIEEIPTQITNYQTTYIPQKDGKRFIEFDNRPGSSKASQYVEDLKYFRDLFVANFNIPPAFLGIEENLSSWNESLSSQNVMFASDVLDYQKSFATQFNELFAKLFKLIYEKTNDKRNLDKYIQLLKKIEIKFNPPLNLKMKMESESINNAITLVDQLVNQFGPESREYFQQKYLGGLVNIAELNKFVRSKAIRKKGETSAEEPTGDTYGGGVGF